MRTAIAITAIGDRPSRCALGCALYDLRSHLLEQPLIGTRYRQWFCVVIYVAADASITIAFAGKDAANVHIGGDDLVDDWRVVLAYAVALWHCVDPVASHATPCCY
jgi:hypothetical protein